MIYAFLIILFGIQVPQVQLNRSQYYDTENGLSNNIVYDIYQDHEGFIWIATENGLNRFDGYEFKKFYQSSKDSSSLSSSIVRSITEDAEGNLWVGTFNGLNLYDRETESFTQYVDLFDTKISRLDLKQMEIDTNGKLWFNTLEISGWFDISNREFHFIESLEDPFSLVVTGSSKILIKSKKGELFEYSDEEKRLKLIGKAEEFFEYPIHWGNYSQQFWSKIPRELVSENLNRVALPNLPNSTKPNKLLEISGNELLLGSDAGLFSYSIDTKILEKIDFGEKSSSLANSIRSIYQDYTGAIWIGTLNGLFHFDPHQKLFNHLDIIEERADIIMAMEVVGEKILLNSFSDNLYSFKWAEKPSPISTNTLPKVEDGFYRVWDIDYLPESDFPLWLATNEGPYLFTKNMEQVKKVTLNKAGEGLPSSFAIVEDEQFVWITSNSALYKAEKKSGNILSVVLPKGGLFPSIIQDVLLLEDGILIATEGDGIWKYEKGAEYFEPLSTHLPETKELLTIPIWDLYQGSDGMVWIGSNKGLSKMDLTTSSLQSVTAGTNFENTIIFSINEDEEGSLWMGTEKGLLLYKTAQHQFTMYTKKDGVVNTEFNRRSTLKTNDGKLWFGGVEGVTFFDPKEIKTNSLIPPVYITGIEIILPDSSLMISKYNSGIEIPWDNNTLEIDFTSLNYTNPSQNKYRYKLEGYDPAWVEGGVVRTARYVHLPHGEYTFKVQASNNDGIWNIEGATLLINITPPFWSTWWFRIMGFTILLMLLWSVYRYRVKQLLEIERVKLRIAGDLHDEIGSGLSGIALTGDILSSQLNNGGVKPELVDRITQSSRYLASSLDTIVWLIDPKKEILGDLISKCQITANDLLSDKKVRVYTSIENKDQQRVLSSANRRNLFLFFKEAIHNVSKHSEAEEVEIYFKKEHSYLTIEIKDNGIGFDISEVSQGRGIGTMNERAKALSSDLVIDSSVGKGTRLRIQVKIP